MTGPAVRWPDRILALRRRLGLTQADFGALLGIGFTHISQWESGRQEPSRPNRRLLQLLEVGGPELAKLVAQLPDPDEEAT